MGAENLPEDPRVEAAIVGFLEAQDAGQAPNPDAWLNAQPSEIHSALRGFLEVMGLAPTPDSNRRKQRRDVLQSLPDWGRYVGLELLGSGGMGAVYKATDTLLGRVVALKALHAEYAADADRTARFLDEARTASQLQHPNIVPVYDYGVMPGEPARPYFTMRLVGRRTLLHAIADHHRAPADGGREALLQQFIAVCGAVAYAHDKGVLHRDLKPQNIMVGTFGEVQVMDWGLSKVLQAPEKPSGNESDDAIRSWGLSESIAGTVRGTLAYMPPEQAAGTPIDPTADVFALGGILLHILTNRAVYVASDAKQLLHAARNGETAAALERLATSGAPPELAELVRSCLNTNAGDRPATAAEVGATVREYVASAEQRAKQAEIDRGRAEERVNGERVRRRWQVVAVAVGLALVFGAVASGIWYRFDRQQRRQQEEARAGEDDRRAFAMRQTVTDGVAKMYGALDRDQFDRAAAALAEAKGGLAPDAPDDLRANATNAQRDFEAVVNFDQIRQERTVLAGDREVHLKPASTRTLTLYAAQFATLGVDPFAPGADILLRASPIRRHLIIALDDWATHESDPTRKDRLLAAAHTADPDPAWGDRFRDPVVRNNQAKLRTLASEVDPEKLSIAQIEALINALASDDLTVLRLIRSAEARFPNDFLVNFAAGSRLLNIATDNPETSRAVRNDAIGYLRTAAAIRPDSLAALALLATLYQLENRPNDIEVIAARVARLDQQSWLQSYVLSLAAHQRRDLRQEITQLRRAVELSAGEGFLQTRLARALLGTGDTAAATQILDAVLAQSPRSFEARRIKAYGLILQQQLPAARQVCLEILRDRPDDSFALGLLSMILIGEGHLAQAEVCLARTKFELQDDPVWICAIGLLDLVRGDSNAALQRIERANQHGATPDTELFASVTYARLGRFADAKAALDRATRSIFENNLHTLPVVGMATRARLFSIRTTLSNFEKLDGMAGPGIPALHPEKLDKFGVLKNAMMIYLGDYLASRQFCALAANVYEIGLTKDSIFARQSLTFHFGSTRLTAARMAAQAWVNGGKDSVRASDADRTRYRKLALGWLAEELESCRLDSVRNSTSSQIMALLDGGTPSAANLRLHLMKMNRDLAPVRDPASIREMPEEDQKRANELWAGVDELLKKLNPPLSLPGLENPVIATP